MNRLSKNRHLVGVLAILLSALIWGTLPIVLRYINGATHVTVFYRVFFAFLSISVIFLTGGRTAQLKAPDRRTVIIMAQQGALLGINWMLFLGAFRYAQVATVELLGYAGPLIVTLLAPFVLKEKLRNIIFVPLLLSFAGLLIILIPHGVEVNRAELLGAGMATLSAFTYATLTLRNKKVLPSVKTSVFIWYQYLAASLLLLPFALYSTAIGDGPTGITSFFWLMIIGVVHTGFTGLLFFAGLRRLRADQSAILTYMEPVSAIILAAIILNEPLTLPTIIGGTMVVVGGVFVARMDAQADIEVLPVSVAESADLT